MLYFAQGWRLAYFDIPFFEDPIEAWRYGPVVSAVYFALSNRKKNEDLTEPVKGYVVQGTDCEMGTPELLFHNNDTELFTRSLWNAYSKKYRGNLYQ
ncbi:MAG: DUF4065 domain-containing protein [Deltaproteobacteria bacterium]|nr:DUF4065 domain-containing protein [Deltaproteobacteria bacterium]